MIQSRRLGLEVACSTHGKDEKREKKLQSKNLKRTYYGELQY
jgi:hypothetical protein